ncbi:MAG: hypothetical protein ACK56F_05050 [bacterium]
MRPCSSRRRWAAAGNGHRGCRGRGDRYERRDSWGRCAPSRSARSPQSSPARTPRRRRKE